VAKAKNAEGFGLRRATVAVPNNIQHGSFKESDASLVHLCLEMFRATASVCIKLHLDLSS
jgi:hypothetical protein